MFENKLHTIRPAVGNTFSVIFAGDICPKFPEAVERITNHCDELVASIKPYFETADLRLLQWECTVTDADTPIDKTGPNLKAPEITLRNMGKALGIDVMLLANNHTGDYCPEATLETIEKVKANGFIPAGAGKNLEDASKTVWLERNGLQIALINFAENEFGTAQKNKPGVAPMSPFKNIAAIRAARQKADVVMVAIHGGHEHYSYPSPEMAELYRQYAEAGADLVWNCHTHCICGCELHNDIPIIYSPGNFYFAYPTSRLAGWSHGYLTKFFCDKKGVYAFELQPYHFDMDHITLLSEEKEKGFLAFMAKISAPLQDPDQLQKLFEAWCAGGHGMSYFQTFDREKLPAWPPVWSEREVIKNMLPIRNLFTCESHNRLMKQTARLIEENRVAEAAALAPEVLALQDPEWAK